MAKFWVKDYALWFINQNVLIILAKSSGLIVHINLFHLNYIL